MNYDPTRHQRRSIRLPGFDYAQAGEYFVTICTQGKTPFFGDVLDGNMCFSKAGTIATQCWSEIPSHFERVSLDTYVVMPNHLHGILTFHTIVGIQNSESLRNTYQHIIPQSLGSVVRSFKGAVTRECNKQGIDFAWQHNYFDHVIRDEKDLTRIREYIQNNPFAWSEGTECRVGLPALWM